MRTTLAVAVVAVLGGAALLILGHAGKDVKGTIQNEVGASVPNRGTTVTAQLPGASLPLRASEATTVPAEGDSRLDNYRLEREGCCIGN